MTKEIDPGKRIKSLGNGIFYFTIFFWLIFILLRLPTLRKKKKKDNNKKIILFLFINWLKNILATVCCQATILTAIDSK